MARWDESTTLGRASTPCATPCATRAPPAGSVDAHAQQRADQAMGAIERLGPAYVKVAQALSTRVDLLPPAYLLAIQRLQDRVPPFPDAEARACIERSFGRPLDQVFSRLSERAVAAASLGQVYRGTLRSSGQEVAIKVGLGLGLVWRGGGACRQCCGMHKACSLQLVAWCAAHGWSCCNRPC